jgi:hypothetical protein
MRDVYVKTESDVHLNLNYDALEANFGAYDQTCWYEDGMFNRNFRDFSQNASFEDAYWDAVKNATTFGNDPHIRWRARTFQFFLSHALPGTCLELGTSHGFMFFFALTYMRSKGFDFGDSRILLIDKFSQSAVDSKSGQPIETNTQLYANSYEEVRIRFNEFEFVEVIEGWVPKVLSTLLIEEIRFLHLDLNAAQTEVAALQFLIPKLSKGATVLLDDYGFPELHESQSAHYALSQQIGYDILSLPTGQGLIIF